MSAKINKKIKVLLLPAGLFLLIICSCLNIFSVSDDIKLGQQVDEEIEADPSTYPILDESEYADAYAYLREIRDEVLQSDALKYTDRFEWEVHIIENDEVLNAFAVPGGYLYFYTGLIKYLDSEDNFAGVMAHEIAHADRRHSTEALTEIYGTSLLLNVVLGDRLDIVQDIALGLSSLAFTRSNESEADEYSVIYLSDTLYACNGAAGFFEQLIEDEAASSPPEFLSTHPNPDNRVEDINAKADELECDTTASGRDYDSFKAMLP